MTLPSGLEAGENTSTACFHGAAYAVPMSLWIITGICKTRLPYHSSDHQVSAPFARVLQRLALTNASFAAA